MIVGLTGGIGSGKTVVSKLFELFGAKVFNSDNNAKQQYLKPSIKQQVVDLLGKECYKADESVDRRYISDKIFSNTDILQKLNAIIHPAVGDDFKLFIKKYQGKLIVKESAILFETGIYKELDKTILVTSPLELRIKRVMQRDGIKEEEVLNKIKSQMNDDVKIKLASYIIYNNEQDLLITQCFQIFKKLNV